MSNMKQTVIYVVACLFIFNLANGQTRYFEPGKSLIFEFTYQSPSKEEVAKGEIIVTPLDSTWQYDKNQKMVNFKYQFSKRDSSYFQIGEHGLAIRDEQEETTGYIENDGYFWTHPFRANIFYITEIAPFPSVFKGSGSVKAKTTLYIRDGWGKFQGKSKRNFKSRKYSGEVAGYEGKNIKQVFMKARHKLGNSTLTLLVVEDLGIIEMNYKFFNGDALLIRLKDVDY